MYIRCTQHLSAHTFDITDYNKGQGQFATWSRCTCLQTKRKYPINKYRSVVARWRRRRGIGRTTDHDGLNHPVCYLINGLAKRIYIERRNIPGSIRTSSIDLGCFLCYVNDDYEEENK